MTCSFGPGTAGAMSDIQGLQAGGQPGSLGRPEVDDLCEQADGFQLHKRCHVLRLLTVCLGLRRLHRSRTDNCFT